MTNKKEAVKALLKAAMAPEVTEKILKSMDDPFKIPTEAEIKKEWFKTFPRWKGFLIKIFGKKVKTWDGDSYLFRDKLYTGKGGELRQSQHNHYYRVK